MALGLFNGQTRPLVDTDGLGGHYPVIKIAAGGGLGLTADVQGVVADGIAKGTTKPVLMGGQDGTLMQSLLTDDAGRLKTVADPFGGSSSTMVDNNQTVAYAPFNTLTGAVGLMAVSSGIYNSTTGFWERWRAANAVAGTTGTGLPGCGSLVFDATNWQKTRGDTSGRTIVVGAAPEGSPATGNILLMGGKDGGLNAQPLYVTLQNSDTIGQNAFFGAVSNSMGFCYNPGTAVFERTRSANGAANTAGTGLLGAGILGFDGTNYHPLRIGNADNLSTGTMIAVVAGNYNESGLDRPRGNTDQTVLASGAQTTTQTVTFTNYNSTHCRVVLDVTTAGTGSITLSIEAQDAVSGKWVALLTGAAVTTVSTNVYEVGPSLTAAANATANRALSRNMRVVVTHNNANTITYSVGRQLTGN